MIAPIGGGGLIAGVAVAVKKRFPEAKIIGVEARNAPSMYNYIKHGLRISDVKPSIADAVVVKKPGDLTSKIVMELVDDIVLVDEEDISYAINFLLERVKIVVEGAGALPVAALLSKAVEVKGEPVVAIVSGGNIDPILLSRIIMHEIAKDGRLVSITGELLDKPGELKSVLETISKYGLNIVDIRHDRWDPRILPNKTALEIIVEARGRDGIENALRELDAKGYRFKIKGREL